MSIADKSAGVEKVDPMHGTISQTQGQQQPDPLVPQSHAEQVDLIAILGIIRRRKWLILATVVCVVGAALLVTSQLQRKYTATTLVVVDSRDSQMLGFTPGLGGDLGSGTLVDTQVQIASSSRVVERAAAKLDIEKWPEYAKHPPVLDMLKAMVGFGEPVIATNGAATFADLPQPEQVRLIDKLSHGLVIQQVGLTNVISMAATAVTPEKAASLANALADAYLADQIESKINSSERAATFLRQRVDGLAASIASQEAKIDAFVKDTLSQLGSPEAQALLAQLRDEAQRRQRDSDALAQMQAALRANDYASLASLAEDQQSGFVAQRQALLDQLSGADTATRMAAAQGQLDALNKQIRDAAEKRTVSLQSEIASSGGKTATTLRQIEATLGGLNLPKELSVELFRLQRDAEASRSLYDSYLTKLRQVEQQTDFNIPDSRVIAPATPPIKPSFPPVTLILLGSLLVSLGAGTGLAFLRENVVGGITSAQQFEHVTGMPMIAGVPRHAAADASSPDAIVAIQPLSGFAEAIRRISRGLEAVGDGKRVCLFVTSPLPGDGKTTVAISLARHFALSGRSTLLVDADLRHPSVHKALGIDGVTNGLIDYLAQGPTLGPRDITVAKDKLSSAFVVLGSDASAIATDVLLMSQRFADLVAFARTEYEIVIIDTPPIGLVVDASIIANHCDAGLFVVRYAATSQRTVAHALRDLTRWTGLPLFGVLNQVQRADEYAYAYKRKYRDYYTATR